ncbi:MAG: tautomerase family protein [Bacillota bacterium]|nr:tautomerase family protein [Bacillota bacterium]
MPNIIFEGGKMDLDKKKELVEKFTEIASRITGIQKEAFTIVIKENSPENVGVGGVLLSEKLNK